MYLMTAVEHWQGEDYTMGDEEPTLMVAEILEESMASKMIAAAALAGTVGLDVAAIHVRPKYMEVFGGDAGDLLKGDLWSVVQALPSELDNYARIKLDAWRIVYDPIDKDLYLHAVTENDEVIDSVGITIG